MEKDPFLNFISDLSEKIKISREHRVIMERVKDPNSSADHNKGSLENLLLTIKEKIESAAITTNQQVVSSTNVLPITSNIVKIVSEEENNFNDFVDRLKNILSKPREKKEEKTIETTVLALSVIPSEQEETEKNVNTPKQLSPKKENKTKDYVNELEKIKDGINVEKEDTKVTEIKKLIEEYAEKYIKRAVGMMGEAGGGSVAVQFANGGTMDGNLNVNGNYLSGGVNLLDIFDLQPDLDNQTLSYNESNYDLSISNGNTVNLSSINTTFKSNSGKYETTFTYVSSNSARLLIDLPYYIGVETENNGIRGTYKRSPYIYPGGSPPPQTLPFYYDKITDYEIQAQPSRHIVWVGLSGRWEIMNTTAPSPGYTVFAFCSGTPDQVPTYFWSTLTAPLTDIRITIQDKSYYDIENVVMPTIFNVTDTVNANSGYWESAIQTVNGTTNQIVATNTGTNNHDNLATISLAQNVIFPGDVTIPGTLTITGTATYINTNSLVINDPIIFLAKNNDANLVDTGFVSHFKTTAPLLSTHTGLVRRANQGVPGYWTLFSGLTTEPLTAVNIDWDDPNIRLDTLSANIATNNGTSDNWNSVYTTVNSNSGNYILDGGNTKNANIVIGTNDPFHFSLETADTRRATFLSSGHIVFGDYTKNIFYPDHTILDILIKGNYNEINSFLLRTNIFGNYNNIKNTDLFSESYDNNIFGSNNIIELAKNALINGSYNYIAMNNGIIGGNNHYVGSDDSITLGLNHINLGTASFVSGKYNILGKKYLALSAESIGNDLYEVSFDPTTYFDLTFTTGSRVNDFQIGAIIGVNSISLTSGIYNTIALVDSKNDTTYKVYLSGVPGFSSPLSYSFSYGEYYLVVSEGDYFTDIYAGRSSFVGGERNYVQGMDSVVFGKFNTVLGDNSVALGQEGYNSGPKSFTLGFRTSAGTLSFAGGSRSLAKGPYSFAYGSEKDPPYIGPVANVGAVAFGQTTLAGGNASFASGLNTKSDIDASIAQGFNSIAVGLGSMAVGVNTVAGLKNVVSFSDNTFTFYSSNSANFDYLSLNSYDYVIGRTNTGADIFNQRSFAAKFIDRNTDSGVITAVNFGQDYPAIGEEGFIVSPVQGAFAAGILTEASGDGTFVAGISSKAIGRSSFAIGEGNIAIGRGSVVMGENNIAIGNGNLVVGINNLIEYESNSNYIEGYDNYCIAGASHLEGQYHLAGSGPVHIEGEGNIIKSGQKSHIEGGSNILGGKKLYFTSFDPVTNVFTFAKPLCSYYFPLNPFNPTFEWSVFGGWDDYSFTFAIAYSAFETGSYTLTACRIIKSGPNNDINSYPNGYMIVYPTENGGSVYYSHVEGIFNIIESGFINHVEGSRNVILDYDSSANHVEGVLNSLSGTLNHVEGAFHNIIANFSHVAGVSAATAFDNTWIWHGNSTASSSVSTTRANQFMVSAAGGVYFPGNVGIGTDANDQALTVVGTISTNKHNNSSSWSGFRSTQTSNFTAYPGSYYIVNTTSSPITGFLPQSPINGTTITFQDSFLQWQTNNFTLNRSGNMIQGLNEDMICDRGGIMFSITYIGGSIGWRVN